MTEVLIHEDFNVRTGANDLALVKLAVRVNLPTFPPACLPGVDQDFTGKTDTVSGEAAANIQ